VNACKNLLPGISNIMFFGRYKTTRNLILLQLVALSALTATAVPTPVQADRMTWSSVETPSSSFNVVVSPSEINFMQMGLDGRTMYATDTANSKVYRSDDAGVSWYDLSRYLLTAGATLPAWQIAAAPDNPHFVAVATTGGGLPSSVFISADGGQTWNNTNFPGAGTISSIAISPNYGSYDIAVGTRSAGSGTVYIYKAAGLGGSWAAQGFSGDILAIKFSPNYRADPSVAILYSTGTGTYYSVGTRDLNANTTNWTSIYSGNPPEITAAGAGTSARANQVITGDLELPVDFSGQSPSMSRAYASIDAAGGSAGIFRIDGNVVYQLMNAQPNRRISSIAYWGTYVSGRLLAGEVLGNSVQAIVFTWYTDAPMTCPATCWYQAEKPPTGAGTSGYGNAQVAWSPDGRAYCGTSSAPLSGPAAWPSAYLNGTPFDESAISISRDNGKTWNQLSLINTQINFLSDVAVTMDSNTIYLATINNAGAGLDSIWRSNGQATGKSWERVLCFPSGSNDIILRLNNVGNDPAIFSLSRGTDDLRQSQDNGQTWKAQLPGMMVTDFSVTSLNNVRYLFALGNSHIRKANAQSTIPQWSPQVATNISVGHTIFAAPNGVIVVGGDSTDNRVAYSMDGGATFNVTTSLLVQGHIHAIVDFRMQNAFIIYAATDSPASDIYALVPGAVPWNPMGAPDKGFWGLAQMITLYGASPGDVDRTLGPESLGPPIIEWSALSQGLMPGVVFTREPVSLKLSSGATLWAIDNRTYNYQANTGRLWTFCDCLSPVTQYTPPPPLPREVLFAAPLVYAPRPDDLIPIYIGSNTIADITFQWRHNTQARAYEIWLARDGDFSQIVLQKTIIPDNRTAPSWTLTDKKGLEQGKTYYWKVRVVQAVTGEKGTGEWSEMLPFTIAKNESAITPNTPEAITSQPPSIAENRTGQTAPPGQIPALRNSENNTNSLVSSIIANDNFWIWLITAALAIALIIVVISGIITSRRRI
jgi:hypothetical protein